MTFVVRIRGKVYETNSMAQAVELLLSNEELEEYRNHGEGD